MMHAERQMVRHLIARQLCGERLSAEEQEILKNWMTDPENRAFFDEMSNTEKLSKRLEEYHYFQKSAGEDWQKVVESAGGLNIRSLKPGSKWRGYMVAASVFFLLAVGAFVVFRGKDKVEPATEGKKDVVIIPPGKDGAVLTLPGGERIVLDDAKNGLITKQGEVEVTKKNGMLSYSLADVDAGSVVYHTLSTPRARQFELDLPDGSKIWLNASSAVTYPTAFQGSERKIKVSGEVYLEVAKDVKRPFVLEVEGAEVIVHGTSFNINSYKEELIIKATLLEGSISVRKGAKTVVIKPGQEAQIKGDNIAVIKNVDADAAVAWKNGMIILDRADIHAMLRSISRWYDVEVEVKGDLVAPGFIGKLPRSLTLNRLLEALQMNSNIKFRLEGRRVIVSP